MMREQREKRETRRSFTSAHFQVTATEKFFSSLCTSFAIIAPTKKRKTKTKKRKTKTKTKKNPTVQQKMLCF